MSLKHKFGIILFMFFLLLCSVWSEGNSPPEIISMSVTGDSFFPNESYIRCYFADPYCGDGFCDSNETLFSCSKDCSMNYRTHLTRLWDEEWDEDIECKGNSNWFATLLKLILGLFLLMVGGYMLYKKLKGGMKNVLEQEKTKTM